MMCRSTHRAQKSQSYVFVWRAQTKPQYRSITAVTLKHRKYVTDIILHITQHSNWMLCSIVLKGQMLYIKLFKTYVGPPMIYTVFV